MSIHYSDQTLPMCSDGKCRWCLDGFTPAEIHDVLGASYRLCPTPGRCPCCDGIGIFPVDFRTDEDVAIYLYSRDMVGLHCDICNGIIEVIPLAGLGV